MASKGPCEQQAKLVAKDIDGSLVQMILNP